MNTDKNNKLLVNKRRNSKQIAGKISTEYNLSKEEEYIQLVILVKL